MKHGTIKGLSFMRLLCVTLNGMQEKKKDLAVAVLFFALLLSVVTTYTGKGVGRIEDYIALKANISTDDLRSRVDGRMMKLSESDARMILMRIQSMSFLLDSQPQEPAVEDAEIEFITAIAPWVLFSFASNTFVLFLASVFFLLLSAMRSASGYDAAVRLPLATLKMAVLLFWSFVRSLVWIPFAGPLIALWMAPRLALSPGILAAGKFGILKSVHESFRRTKGKWFRVTFALLGLGVLSLTFLFFAILPVSALSVLSLKLSFFLWLLLVLFMISFQMFFLVRLCEESA